MFFSLSCNKHVFNEYERNKKMDVTGSRPKAPTDQLTLYYIGTPEITSLFKIYHKIDMNFWLFCHRLQLIQGIVLETYSHISFLFFLSFQRTHCMRLYLFWIKVNISCHCDFTWILWDFKIKLYINFMIPSILDSVETIIWVWKMSNYMYFKSNDQI